MKLRVKLGIYTHSPADHPEVLEQLHIPQQTEVEVSTDGMLLVVTGPKDEVSEVIFMYCDRNLEDAAAMALYEAEVVS